MKHFKLIVNTDKENPGIVKGCLPSFDYSGCGEADIIQDDPTCPDSTWSDPDYPGDDWPGGCSDTETDPGDCNDLPIDCAVNYDTTEPCPDYETCPDCGYLDYCGADGTCSNNDY